MLKIQYDKKGRCLIIEPAAGEKKPGIRAYQIGMIKKLWSDMRDNVRCRIISGGRKLLVDLRPPGHGFNVNAVNQKGRRPVKTGDRAN